MSTQVDNVRATTGDFPCPQILPSMAAPPVPVLVRPSCPELPRARASSHRPELAGAVPRQTSSYRGNSAASRPFCRRLARRGILHMPPAAVVDALRLWELARPVLQEGDGQEPPRPDRPRSCSSGPAPSRPT